MRRLASRNAVDALQGTPADEQPDQQPAKTHDAQRHGQSAPHDGAESLRFAEIAADHDDHLVGQPQNESDRRVPRLRLQDRLV